MSSTHKIKHLTYDLIDIGIHESYKGLQYIKSTQMYEMTDKYINYDEKFELMREKGINAFKFVNDRVYIPLKENLYVFID